MSREFSWPVRVYYEDTDSAGVVYYANYLRFMERARTEWLRSIGVEQDVLREQQAVIFVVRSVQIDFMQPARFNDALQVVSRIKELRKASMVFQQDIIKMDGGEPRVLCQASIRIAALRVDDMRPCPIPDDLLREISNVD